MLSLFRQKIILIFLIAYLCLFLLCINNGFFWDTTHLASLQAWWYYDNDFKFFFLPTEIDSGHPSFFAMLLALLWKIFGVSIAVSHLMMLPFLIILIFEAASFARFYFKDNWAFVAGMILFNPVILGQSTLVSPDVVLICFFFCTLNGIVQQKRIKIIIGAFLLGGISLRGIMCLPYLFLFCVLREKWSIKLSVRYLLLFMPGILLAALFLLFHYKNSGWIGYHIHSPWAESFERVGIKGFLRNCVVFAWRMVDMGFVFLWIFLFAIILQNRSNFRLSKRTRELMLLLILCFAGSVLLQFFYRYSLLHRYLLPLISIVICIFSSIAEDHLSLKRFKSISLIMIAALLSGNLWVFPDNIAKGWDATLAHLPYYKLRHEALDCIREKNIPLNEVSAGFPYYYSAKCIDLDTDTTDFSRASPENAQYTLYSNISNDYTDEQLLLIKTKFKPICTFGKWPVRFVLYKNPDIK